MNEIHNFSAFVRSKNDSYWSENVLSIRLFLVLQFMNWIRFVALIFSI